MAGFGIRDTARLATLKWQTELKTHQAPILQGVDRTFAELTDELARLGERSARVMTSHLPPALALIGRITRERALLRRYFDDFGLGAFRHPLDELAIHPDLPASTRAQLSRSAREAYSLELRPSPSPGATDENALLQYRRYRRSFQQNYHWVAAVDTNDPFEPSETSEALQGLWLRFAPQSELLHLSLAVGLRQDHAEQLMMITLDLAEGSDALAQLSAVRRTKVQIEQLLVAAEAVGDHIAADTVTLGEARSLAREAVEAAVAELDTGLFRELG